MLKKQWISLLALGILFLFFSSVLQAQNRRAKRFFERAEAALQAYDYGKALAFLDKAVDADSLYFEAWQMMGDLSLLEEDEFRAIHAYRKALASREGAPKDMLMTLARLEWSKGYYEEADAHFSQYAQKGELSERTACFLEEMHERIAFARELMAHPVPFDPQNLGPEVNSPYDDYINAVSVDDRVMMLTVKAPSSYHYPFGDEYRTEDFYLSRRDSAGWGKATSLGPPVNTRGNEGALSLSPDGQFLLFTGCDRPDNNGRCDLYLSYREGDCWSEAVNLGRMVNSDYWEAQPAISSDGKTLYFVSNRKGGHGETDIWRTTINRDGSLSKPENMGDVINTKGSEMAPYIHPDGNTLYFASDGHLGMGGKDLFVSRRIKGNEWSKPENLGYPVNTWADELSLIVAPDGKRAYFSSDKREGEGGYDVYVFALPEEVRPTPVTYLKGRVYDRETGVPLQADFVLSDVVTGEERVASFSDREDGTFLVCIPGGCDYFLHVVKEGYLYYSDSFFLQEENSVLHPFEKDVPLVPLKKGNVLVTRNIFFDTDRYEVKEVSLPELLMVKQLLDDNPGVKMEVVGHTDSMGTPDYNRRLSENRAKAVVEKLLGLGISADRLSYKGMGSTMPVDVNNTPEGRAKNRRTEFVIQ
ncbi:MAG: hypothetical protein CSA95_07525 [Bacteroidetes bacterium]|nr:MAG: hypothetical protein CSA95_07525 [Bacteroidota bacterium]PIE88773.1 MAG: hypothetical protein CSA04_00175 [Bacteroidota bacterium]